MLGTLFGAMLGGFATINTSFIHLFDCKKQGKSSA